MMLHSETNSDISALLGCKLARISNFRCCASKPTNIELTKLAEHYNVPINFLYGDSKLIVMSEDRGGNQSVVSKELI
jgi:hypothetical protein